MSDDTRQLTPLGQMLIAKMKSIKGTHAGCCKVLRLTANTWYRCLTGRLDTLTPNVRDKLKRWLGVTSLPEAPEDLSLMHNLVAAHDPDYAWTPPTKSLEQVSEFRGTNHMRHYLLAYANRLSEYIHNVCDNVMAVEIYTRFTQFPAAAVDLDVFTMDKPITKLRLTLALSGSMSHIDYRLGEYSQQHDNVELKCFSKGELTKEAMHSILTRIIPMFCFKSRPDPELTALEKVIRPKKKVKDASHSRNTIPAGAGEGKPPSGYCFYTSRKGKVSLRKIKRIRGRPYRRRTFGTGTGRWTGRLQDNTPGSGGPNPNSQKKGDQ